MPRHTRHDPDDEDDFDPSDEYAADRDYDPDDPETYPAGLYAADGPPGVPCPYCREEIAEDAERCPHCGNYLSKEDAPPGERKGGVWVWLMVLALVAALMMAVG